MHKSRETLRAFARRETLNLLLDRLRHYFFLLQRQAAQDHDRYRHNRASQQRPHEKAAPREKSEHGIHESSSCGNDPGGRHRFMKIVKGISMRKPSAGSVAATSSEMAGNCAS